MRAEASLEDVRADRAAQLGIGVSVGAVTRALALAIAVQSLVGFALVYLTYFRGWAVLEDVVRPFNLDIENTIPAIYQTLQLGLCAVVLAVIARAGRPVAGIVRERLYWWLLAGIFGYLMFDEGASIHELANGPVRRLLGLGGIFYWAWIIPAAALVCVLGLVFLRFVLALPPRTRLLFIVAGGVYVFAAIGLEALGARWSGTAAAESAVTYGAFLDSIHHPLRYLLETTAEETLEPLGILLFLRALLEVIATHVPRIEVLVGDECPNRPRGPVLSTRTSKR